MSIIYKINGVTLTNRVRLLDEGEGFVTAAERGVVATGGVLIDDDDATLTINGWQPFTVDDDEAFPYSRVFTGFIVERDIGRNARYRTSTARVHDCAILDVNEYLHLHVNRANAAKRAAETDVARVAWLLTSEALSGLVYDRGLVSTANAGSFLESDTRRRFADDVMGELAPSSVKNFFVYWDNATATPGLFYGRDTLTSYASTLRISNVAADVDNVVTFAPSIDARMQRQPNDQYGGVSYGWRGDPIYVQSATTIAAMGILRDAVYDTDRIGLLATAQQASKDWLNVRATETDFITVTLIVPSARINDIYAGQRIQVKFSHIPGYTSFTYTRVRRRAVKPVAPQFWEMRLELWVPSVPVTDAAVSGGGACGQGAFVRVNGQQNSATAWSGYPSVVITSPTIGNTLLMFVGGTDLCGDVTASGWTRHADLGPTAGHLQNSRLFVFSRVVASGDTGTYTLSLSNPGGRPNQPLSYAILEYSGGSFTTFDTSAYSAILNDATPLAPSVTPTAGLPAVVVSIWSKDPADTGDAQALTGFSTRYIGPNAVGGTYRRFYIADRLPLMTSGSYAGIDWSNSGWGNDEGIAWTGVFTCTGSPTSTPSPEQFVSESLGYGNGTTTAFTTTYPFADGSLTVFVDRLDQTAAATVTNAALGTFTLGFAPLASELVEVTYLGR